MAAAKEAQRQARARAVDKQEQLCELSRALAVLASASVRSININFIWIHDHTSYLCSIFCCWCAQSVSTEREEFLRLVNKEVCLTHEHK